MIYYYLMRITAWIPEERPRSKNLNVVIKVWSCLSMWFTVVDGCLRLFLWCMVLMEVGRCGAI